MVNNHGDRVRPLRIGLFFPLPNGQNLWLCGPFFCEDFRGLWKLSEDKGGSVSSKVRVPNWGGTVCFFCCYCFNVYEWYPIYASCMVYLPIFYLYFTIIKQPFMLGSKGIFSESHMSSRHYVVHIQVVFQWCEGVKFLMWKDYVHWRIAGGNSNMFSFHPYLGKIPNLTNTL